MANAKYKEIQVQKPAQSLEAFKGKVASGEDLNTGMMRQVLMVGAGLVVVVLGWFAFSTWRAGKIEQHEAAVASLVSEVQGDGMTPVTPEETEKRLRERLPRLETLAASAPSASRATTLGLLATWKLQLEGKGGMATEAKDPWSRLRLAQKQVALGQAAEAASTLAPLKGKADADEAWAQLYWTTLLEVDRLQGHREQAWKDYADYKTRFKDRADTQGMERILASI